MDENEELLNKVRGLLSSEFQRGWVAGVEHVIKLAEISDEDLSPALKRLARLATRMFDNADQEDASP